MKYWELIRVGGKTSAPTPAPKEDVTTSLRKLTDEEIAERNATTESIVKDIIEEQNRKNEETSQNVKTILAFMEELKNKDWTPPAELENTSLNREETCDVLTMLLDFQKKYFYTTPLTRDLSRAFVYNIPKPVYEAAKTAEVKGYPDCLNPLYWFFMTQLGDPEYMLPMFLISAINAIKDDDYNIIENLASKYAEECGITAPVIDDEADEEDLEGITEYMEASTNPDDIDISLSDNDEIIETTDNGSSATDIGLFDPDVNDESLNTENEEENNYETGNSEENG